MYFIFMPDLRAKATAYGSFGHQTVFDTNVPYKLGYQLGQPSTNLVNVNNVRKKVIYT